MEEGNIPEDFVTLINDIINGKYDFSGLGVTGVNNGDVSKPAFVYIKIGATGYSKSNYSLPQNRSYASLYNVNPYNVTTFEPDIKNFLCSKCRFDKKHYNDIIKNSKK